MSISQALRIASLEQKWSPAKIAAEAGMSEGAARKWLAGSTTPSGDALMNLRRKLPGFADLLDGKTAVA